MKYNIFGQGMAREWRGSSHFRELDGGCWALEEPKKEGRPNQWQVGSG